jgi:hypothetical protein
MCFETKGFVAGKATVQLRLAPVFSLVNMNLKWLKMRQQQQQQQQ